MTDVNVSNNNMTYLEKSHIHIDRFINISLEAMLRELYLSKITDLLKLDGLPSHIKVFLKNEISIIICKN